ncbi:MAG: aldehyde dehydrogenase family protein [Labilithrix sp.]|nr:aldehyde dehydrogenase family protein [Labilithrix sp.]MCW5815768.1 aldehyde dehydrogenase family protein [Labilithrix sp.]
MTKLKVVQAFDRAVFAETDTDDAASLESKLARAAALFADRSRALRPYRRAEVLRQAAVLVGARREELARRIAQEGGKPLADARVEVTRAIDGLRDAADELRSFAGAEVPMGLTPASDGRWAFTTKEPIGVVAAISAFNHPLNLIVHQVAPAIAVGCPVIVKPATATPLSCVAFVELLRAAGLPEDHCQVLVTEDNALAERLATDPRIAFLSFIGSAKVGWYLRSKLAPGARCALEHGGAAPVVVDRSAKLDAIVEPLVKGAYYHAGQVCVSVQRVFAHAAIADDLAARLEARIGALRTGDPLRPDTEVGPLILPREVDRVEAWIAEARSGGARVTGGRRASETTLEPAVIVEPPADAKVSALEVFGPVVCVYRYTDLDDAIARANALPWAFQASVFASDIEPALRVARRIDASTVLVNDHTAFRTDWMPFAGRRQSGYGTGGIPYSMRDMTHEKMIVLRHDDP